MNEQVALRAYLLVLSMLRPRVILGYRLGTYTSSDKQDQDSNNQCECYSGSCYRELVLVRDNVSDRSMLTLF